MTTPESPTYEIATLGGGCFWCLEPVFLDLQGVTLVESGYAGGTVVNPTYDQVCSGKTGHAEVVQVTFDPQVIAFKQILEIFFTVHDPTTLNRQGNDVGTQYRSVILYHTDEQKAIAEAVIGEIHAAKIWKKPIVTEIAPFTTFYRAEDYHQQYYQRNGWQPYCQIIIAPKLDKFRKQYAQQIKR